MNLSGPQKGASALTQHTIAQVKTPLRTPMFFTGDTQAVVDALSDIRPAHRFMIVMMTDDVQDVFDLNGFHDEHEARQSQGGQCATRQDT